MKAFINPHAAASDPILIRKFPDPNNPSSLDPQFSTWINQFGSAADLAKLFEHHIQSRFFQIFSFYTFPRHFEKNSLIILKS